MNAVTSWFGNNFDQLHPLLQKLHKEGGVLTGKVSVQFGKGIAGFIGRKIAPKLGLPLVSGEVEFKVTIKHSQDALYWNRLFCNEFPMSSTFKPHGVYPNGYWSETTGKLLLELGVEIREGGWYWVQRKIKFCGIPLPIWLFPSSHAYKKIEDGKYRFSVSFRLPVIGQLVSYSGDLAASSEVIGLI